MLSVRIVTTDFKLCWEESRVRWLRPPPASLRPVWNKMYGRSMCKATNRKYDNEPLHLRRPDFGSSTVPQTPAASDNFSVLDHLRHLLAEDPKIAPKGLHGGLDFWLLSNTREVLQWAGNARDAWQGRN